MSVWRTFEQHQPAASRLIPKPTREAICGGRHRFQGLTVSTTQLGPDRPWFDPDVAALHAKADRLAVYAAHRAVGDTHICLSLNLGGLSTLPTILDVAREAIVDGGLTGIILMCMGDGQVQGGDHNPGSLGFEWFMENFPKVYRRTLDYQIGNHFLTDHIIFVPGFDGVVPAWQPPTRVDEAVLMMRKHIDISMPFGYLGLELSAGYAVWGSAAGAETNNWATPAGQCVDVILQEGPIDMGPPEPVPTGLTRSAKAFTREALLDNPYSIQRMPQRAAYMEAVRLQSEAARLPQARGAGWETLPEAEQKRWTQCYQMIGRSVRPFYPIPNQPDDPHPPFHLAGGTPRGPYYYWWWEYDTYRWTSPWRNGGRGMTVAEVEAHRDAARAMGCTHVG